MKCADAVLMRLRQWGVRRVYGYPGDGINGLLGAFQRTQEVRWTQVAHEEMAAFMATAHAKFTGEVGVCMATSGPGAIHLLNGLYDAKMDHVPVLAIVGQVARISLGTDFQQEVNLVSLFSDVASAYTVQVSNPAGVRQAIDRGMRIAIATRSPTCVIIPKDVQEMDAEAPPTSTGPCSPEADTWLRKSFPLQKISIAPPRSSTRGSASPSSSVRAASVPAIWCCR